MEPFLIIQHETFYTIIVLLVLTVWSLIWKGIALWKAGSRKQLSWFIPLFIINTFGILPIIYLIINRGKK